MTRGELVQPDVCRAIVYMSSIYTAEEISLALRRPIRTVYAILAKARSGADFLPKPRGPRGSYVLSEQDIQYLIMLIQRSPDLYLDELKERLFEGTGASPSIPTIYRALRRAGFTRKTITKAARERDDAKRAEYCARIAQYLPHERVYVDESRFDRRTSTRTRAWAFCGERAFSKVFFLRGKSYSILPALSLDGILHVKVVENAFIMETFNEFIRELIEKMNPYDPVNHNKNSVIIMDNCRIHKDPEMIEMAEQRGVRIEYLPPYSPDYNPIELCFSGMKAWFRRNGNDARNAWEDVNEPTRPVDLLIAMTQAVSRENAFGWFGKASVL
ncbi:hypothetical protein FRC16_008491 [Serendipita sp. 398]|nr:hypothetical protein FRC16_008491 [Serendipita sp. 398]